MIGSINSDMVYTVMFGSLQLTGVICNATNYCVLRVNGSQLSVNGLLTVSVVASNPLGSGPTAMFPTPGLCDFFHSVAMVMLALFISPSTN